MSDSANPFFWYELMTTDAVAAENFYRAVVGWGTEDAGGANAGYTLLTVNNKGVAGIMPMPAQMCEAGGRPSWVGYIHVDDVDAYSAKIEQKGGKIHRAPDDIPEVGRFAVVADPHGAVFNLMAPQGEAPTDYPAPNAPGMAGWRELFAGDGPEAFDFYSGLFGWQKGQGMDMGEMGVYQIFQVGGQDVGAIMTKPKDVPAPFWNYYFNVDDINSAIERVKENGGQILMGPHEVPGGSWIVQCFDPQGAMFSLVAPPK